MGKYFGTDGFRGEANVTLNVEHAFKVGRFLGWYYRKNTGKECKIVIGKDTRRSSYMFEDALCAGLTASGANAYLLHVTTTPSVSYVVRTEGFDCGIMISASHNPYYDNGIKLLNASGEKMEEDTIALIEKYLDGDLESLGVCGNDLPYATGDDIGYTQDFSAGRNRYIGYLISLAVYSFRGKKIALDCANGSAWMIAKNIFDALGAQTLVINASPNGLNINENAGSTHISHLCEYVKANNCDAGFAFDGDADRCLAVDENGDVIDGDAILYIYGVYLKNRGKLLNNTVVTTVMSNFGLYKAFENAGIDYEKTDVGDKYVYECMQKNGHRLGGEQSGHIIFSKYATTGDGIITALKMMEVMLASKQTLSELAKPFVKYPQVLVNVRVSDKAKVQNDERVKAAIEKAVAELGNSGRILVRESGTEPLIRVMAEAESEELCKKLTNDIVAVVEEVSKSL